MFVNRKTQPSGPAPTPFHTAIPPIRPAIYFYDTEGQPMAAESVVDITEDLEVTENGALTVRTYMEPLGVVTISTHGRGDLVSGSVKGLSARPIGGVLRFDLPGIGVAGVGVSSPVSDALFPVRRQEGGINTGVAVHNLGEEAMGVTCELMQGGTVLDDVSIPLEANGQSSWFIDEVFTAADTSDFVGSVRCTAPGEGMFAGVAVELDAASRIYHHASGGAGSREDFSGIDGGGVPVLSEVHGRINPCGVNAARWFPLPKPWPICPAPSKRSAVIDRRNGVSPLPIK